MTTVACSILHIELSYAAEGEMLPVSVPSGNGESLQKLSNFNSHAGGMAVARSDGFEIDFVRNPVS